MKRIKNKQLSKIFLAISATPAMLPIPAILAMLPTQVILAILFLSTADKSFSQEKILTQNITQNNPVVEERAQTPLAEKEESVVLRGEIINATTGAKTVVSQLTLMQLTQQMDPIETIHNAGPFFRFSPFLYQGNPLLIQAEFQDGRYNTLLPPGVNLQEIQRLTVYANGALKQNIRISALMWITKHKEKIRIENVYLIENRSQPPRSYNLASEKFFVSRDASTDSIQATLKQKSMPIPLQLRCLGEEKEICSVQRQLPPGLNELRIFYEVSGHEFVDRMVTDMQSDSPEKMVFYKPVATRPIITPVKKSIANKIQDLDLKILGQALRVPYVQTDQRNFDAHGLIYNVENGPYLIEDLMTAHENPLFDSSIRTILGLLLIFSFFLFLGSLIVRPSQPAKPK